MAGKAPPLISHDKCPNDTRSIFFLSIAARYTNVVPNPSNARSFTSAGTTLRSRLLTRCTCSLKQREAMQPVAEGEVGEMVVTSLCKEAVPLLRYRTHDLSRLLPGKCSCGLGMGACTPRLDFAFAACATGLCTPPVAEQ